MLRTRPRTIRSVRFPGDGNRLREVPAHRKAAHLRGRGAAEEVRHHLPRSGSDDRVKPGVLRRAYSWRSVSSSTSSSTTGRPPCGGRSVRLKQGHGLQHRCVPGEHRGLLRRRRRQGPGGHGKLTADQEEPLRHEVQLQATRTPRTSSPSRSG